MADPFETLSLPARPWIERSALQSRFHELAAQKHPDSSSHPESQAAFQALNEAHQILKNPVSRLRCLLEKEAPDQLQAAQSGGISPELSDRFLSVATLLRQVSAFCDQQTAARSPLAKAVLRSEHLALRSDVERALAQVNELWHRAETQIQAADSVWDRRTPGILSQLATLQHEMTFLQRWRLQLREARLRMSD
ncbi:MAG: DnaJ domain [Verrucomicrobiota bacterium]|jgi:curved DNA-binding protein CbpA